MASDSRHDLRTTSSRLTNGAPQSNENPLLASDGTSRGAAGAPTTPLRATVADLFGESQPDDLGWVARQQAHLAHVKALADELPDPEIPWQPWSSAVSRDPLVNQLALWLADVAVEAATPAAQGVGTAPSNRAKTGSGRAAVMPPRSQRLRR